MTNRAHQTWNVCLACYVCREKFKNICETPDILASDESNSHSFLLSGECAASGSRILCEKNSDFRFLAKVKERRMKKMPPTPVALKASILSVDFNLIFSTALA